MSAGSPIQFISLGSAAFGLVMLIVTLFQMRKETWLKPLQSLIMLVSFTFPTVMLLVASGGMVNYTLGALFLMPGLLIGLIIGALLKLRGADGGVVGKRSRFPTLAWGLSSLVAPLLARTGSAALFALGLMGVLFGLGLVAGCESVLLLRTLVLGWRSRRAVQPVQPYRPPQPPAPGRATQPPPPAVGAPLGYGPAPAAGPVCPYPDCGRPLRAGLRFCPYCGRSVVQAAPAVAAPVEQRCPTCGRVLPAGARFCAYDGTRIA